MSQPRSNAGEMESQAKLMALQTQYEAHRIKCKELEVLNADMEDYIETLRTMLKTRESEIDQLKQGSGSGTVFPGHHPGCPSCSARDALICDLLRELSEMALCERCKAKTAQSLQAGDQDTAHKMALCELQHRLTEVEARARHAETCVDTMQLERQTLVRTACVSTDNHPNHHLSKHHQTVHRIKEDGEKQFVGVAMESLLAHVVRKLVHGTLRLAASNDHLKATYRIRNLSAHLFLTTLVRRLKAGEVAIKRLLHLTAPHTEICESKASQKEPSIAVSNGKQYVCTASFKHSVCNNSSDTAMCQQTMRASIWRASGGLEIVRRVPRLRSVALALIACLRIWHLQRESMATAYRQARENDTQQHAQKFLVHVCKCVESMMLPSNQMNRQSARQGKAEEAAKFMMLLDALASGDGHGCAWREGGGWAHGCAEDGSISSSCTTKHVASGVWSCGRVASAEEELVEFAGNFESWIAGVHAWILEAQQRLEAAEASAQQERRRSDALHMTDILPPALPAHIHPPHLLLKEKDKQKQDGGAMGEVLMQAEEEVEMERDSLRAKHAEAEPSHHGASERSGGEQLRLQSQQGQELSAAVAAVAAARQLIFKMSSEHENCAMCEEEAAQVSTQAKSGQKSPAAASQFARARGRAGSQQNETRSSAPAEEREISGAHAENKQPTPSAMPATSQLPPPTTCSVSAYTFGGPIREALWEGGSSSHVARAEVTSSHPVLDPDYLESYHSPHVPIFMCAPTSANAGRPGSHPGEAHPRSCLSGGSSRHAVAHAASSAPPVNHAVPPPLPRTHEAKGKHKNDMSATQEILLFINDLEMQYGPQAK